MLLTALEVGKEADNGVAEFVGLHTLDADVLLLVRVDLRAKLEKRPALGDRKRRVTRRARES